jgi:hypothetical protein
MISSFLPVYHLIERTKTCIKRFSVTNINVYYESADAISKKPLNQIMQQMPVIIVTALVVFIKVFAILTVNHVLTVGTDDYNIGADYE